MERFVAHVVDDGEVAPLRHVGELALGGGALPPHLEASTGLPLFCMTRLKILGILLEDS